MKRMLVLLLLLYAQGASAMEVLSPISTDTSIVLTSVEDTSYLKLREKARSRIKSAGWSLGAGVAVFGAGLGLKDLERERAQPDIVGQKGRNVLGDVLLAIGGILLIGALVLFVSWIGMKKGKKESRVSLFAKPTYPYAGFPKAAPGIRVRLGRR